jgi:hypothetical protein
MKLFIAKRTESVGYDEHDSVVVRARTKNDARVLVMTGYFDGPYSGFRPGNFTLTELTADGPAGEVIASFNAG